MMVIFIIVSAMIFFFSVFTIILYGITKDRMKVEERIKGFVTDEREKKTKQIKKNKRLKVKKNTGFRTRKELAQIENELYNVGINIPVQEFLIIWLCISIIIPFILVIVGLSKIICFVCVVVFAIVTNAFCET